MVFTEKLKSEKIFVWNVQTKIGLDWKENFLRRYKISQNHTRINIKVIMEKKNTSRQQNFAKPQITKR